MDVELGRLRKANDMLSKRKTRTKKLLRGVSTLSIADGLQLSSQHKEQRTAAQNGRSGEGAAQRRRCCGRCHQPGHNTQTCKTPFIHTIEIVDPRLLASQCKALVVVEIYCFEPCYRLQGGHFGGLASSVVEHVSVGDKSQTGDKSQQH